MLLEPMLIKQLTFGVHAMQSNPTFDASPCCTTCCPCCGEYYSFFLFSEMTVMFCDDVQQSLLDEVADLPDERKIFSTIFLDCNVNKLVNARIERR